MKKKVLAIILITLITILSLQLKEATATPPRDQRTNIPDKIDFPRQISLGQLEIKSIPLNVENVELTELFFKLNVYFDEVNSDPGYDGFDLMYEQGCLTLLPAQANVYEINIKAPDIPGIFALRADVLQYADDKCTTQNVTQLEYATKLSFLEISTPKDDSKGIKKLTNWLSHLLSYLKSWF